MRTSIEELVAVAGQAIGPGYRTVAPGGSRAAEVLAAKNGFYAFEGALHVFPEFGDDRSEPMSKARWNAVDLWRDHYGSLAEGLDFFAEDVFGGQFCLRGESVYQFDPETADIEFLAQGLENWAGLILQDYDYLTGYSLAHEWQEENGRILAGQRLVPKVPFVAGGEFAISNLFSADAVTAMRSRGGVAVQLSSIPDGASVIIRVEDDEVK